MLHFNMQTSAWCTEIPRAMLTRIIENKNYFDKFKAFAECCFRDRTSV